MSLPHSDTPAPSLAELVEEAVPCLYVDIKREFADATHPELVAAVRMCRDDTPCPKCRQRTRLLAAIARLEAERDEYRREWESACERERARWSDQQRLEAENAAIRERVEFVAKRGLLAYRRAKGSLCWNHPERPCGDCEREFAEFLAAPKGGDRE